MREYQINSIVYMLAQIEDVRFLNQIRTILRRHINKGSNPDKGNFTERR